MNQVPTEKNSPMEQRMISLSAVLVLMDGFYNGKRTVIGDTEVILKEGTNPQKKSNELYAAVNLAGGCYHVTIRSQYYLLKNTTIEIPTSTSSSIGETLVKIPITLQPSPIYPYPENTTLIRGYVFDAVTGLPIGGGKALLLFGKKEHEKAVINGWGQFVFSFSSIPVKKRVKVVVCAPDYQQTSVDLDIYSEKTTSFRVLLQKNTNTAEISISYPEAR